MSHKCNCSKNAHFGSEWGKDHSDNKNDLPIPVIALEFQDAVRGDYRPKAVYRIVRRVFTHSDGTKTPFGWAVEQATVRGSMVSPFVYSDFPVATCRSAALGSFPGQLVASGGDYKNLLAFDPKLDEVLWEMARNDQK